MAIGSAWSGNRVLWGAIVGASIAAACGNGDDFKPFDEASQAEVNRNVPLPPAPERNGPPGNTPSTDPPSNAGGSNAVGSNPVGSNPVGSGASGAGGGTLPVGSSDEPRGEQQVPGPGIKGPLIPRPECQAPAGISASPTTIPQAVALMNALPKPTTLECFISSLDRPIDVYATSSSQSLQPAPDAHSPRTFIVRGPLEMSIVPDGDARITIELGYRPTLDQSIKTEIAFPLEKPISMNNVFDRVISPAGTECGRCHVGEQQMTYDGFPDGAWISQVNEPQTTFDVPVDALRDDAESCDPSDKPDRCDILWAVFDYGDVRQTKLGLVAAQ